LGSEARLQEQGRREYLILWCSVDFKTRSDAKYWIKFQFTSGVNGRDRDLKNRKIIELERQQREYCCGFGANIWKFEDVTDTAEQFIALSNDRQPRRNHEEV
jgi:hypothetical protein